MLADIEVVEEGLKKPKELKGTKYLAEADLFERLLEHLSEEGRPVLSLTIRSCHCCPTEGF